MDSVRAEPTGNLLKLSTSEVRRLPKEPQTIATRTLRHVDNVPIVPDRHFASNPLDGRKPRSPVVFLRWGYLTHRC